MPIQPVAYGGYYQPYVNNPFSIFGGQNIQNYRIQRQNNNSIFSEEKRREINGKNLFENAVAGLPSSNPEPPMCAKYVKNALVNSGLGIYELGNGEQMKYILRRNPNFREISVKGEDLKYLPEGTIITYDAFDSAIGENGEIYNVGEDGHVVIKGKGNYGVSDRFEDYIIPSDNSHTFILA